MSKHSFIRDNESGVVLLIGLLTLVILMAIGIAATTTSRLEVEIAGNDKTYKEAFYTAEMALKTAELIVDTLPNRVAFLEETTPGHYSKHSQPAWEEAVLWDSTHSMPVPLDDLPDGLKQVVDAASLPRYAIEERQFKADSLGRGIGVTTGTYYFTVTGRGTRSGNKAPVVFLETVYARRYD